MRRDKWTNSFDSSRAEQVSQRVPYNGSQKQGNGEYESNSLRAFFSSFERHLKKKNYGLYLMKDVQFEQTLTALQSKLRDLKRKGKGNKPNASAALSEEDIQVLYEKDLLASSTAETI